MSLRCPVVWCGRDFAGHATVCDACAGQLARQLSNIPWLAAHLTVTLTRQARLGEGGKRGTGTPMPYDQRASDVAKQLRDTVSTWVQRLLEGTVPVEGPVCPRCRHVSCAHIKQTGHHDDDPAAGARWLLAELRRIERHPDAAEIIEDIAEAVEVTEKTIDRPPEQWYAGACDTCGRDLYADPGATLVQCRNCSSAYGVAGRREQLLAAAEDVLAPATQAARALTALGEALSPERIWKWAERGRITPHGTDAQGRPQYRIGDLRMLIGELEAKTAERRAKTADPCDDDHTVSG